MKETIPAATIPVEEIAAHMSTTPRKLRIALARAAAAGYVIDLGRGLRTKVELVEEADLSADSDHELTELARLGCLAALKPRRIRLAAPSAHEQHQRLLAAPPASKRIQ